MLDEDRPKQTPHLTTVIRGGKAGRQIGALCQGMHQKDGEAAFSAFYR